MEPFERLLPTYPVHAGRRAEEMDAIDARDFEGLAEELGDLLLQPVFFAQMASEEGRFDIADSLTAINNKLVRRHPHVFADGEAKTSDDVLRRWDARTVTARSIAWGAVSMLPVVALCAKTAEDVLARANDLYERLQGNSSKKIRMKLDFLEELLERAKHRETNTTRL